MRVVDTSAWIEGVARGGFDRRIVALLPSREFWVVPTIVQFELAKWLRREASPDFTESALAYSNKCRRVELSTDIALHAATLAARYKLSTADAIIYATALEVSADLLTCDAHFEGLPQVVYLPKLDG